MCEGAELGAGEGKLEQNRAARHLRRLVGKTIRRAISVGGCRDSGKVRGKESCQMRLGQWARSMIRFMPNPAPQQHGCTDGSENSLLLRMAHTGKTVEKQQPFPAAVDKTAKSDYNRNNTAQRKGEPPVYSTARGSFFYFSYRFTGFAFRKAVLRCTD